VPSKLKGLLIVALQFLAFSTLPSHAAIWSARPYCESRFSRTPREVIAFRDELNSQAAVQATQKSFKLSDTYSTYATQMINNLLASSRYSGNTAELKSRLIAFSLVEWLRIPNDRNSNIKAVSAWLVKSVDDEPAFSAADIERLRIAYQIYVRRRASFIPFDGEGYFSRLAGTAIGDTALTAILSGATATLAAGLGWEFFPLPALLLFSHSKYFVQTKLLQDLDLDTQQLILATDAKLVNKLSDRIPVAQLKLGWTSALSGVIQKNGTIVQEGLLLKLMTESCGLLSDKPDNQKDSFKLIVGWARDLKQVNPVDWKEILEAIKIIRSTSMRLNFTEVQAGELIRSLKPVIDGWSANDEARAAGEALLATNFHRTSLNRSSL
jgi:hypothetical protein